jgi:dipeptidyl aminopeptidase/acylaminoacyl peptidase
MVRIAKECLLQSLQRKRNAGLRTFAWLFLIVLSLSAANTTVARGLVVEDILKMEGIGRVSFALNDRLLIYEWMPPYAEASNIGTLYGQSDRSALAGLYVADVDRLGTSCLLFPQEPNGGYWLGPVSPDTSRVAVFSLLAGEVKLGVTDLDTGRTLWFPFTPNYYWIQQKPLWLSETELIAAAVPSGEQPSIVYRPGFARRVNELWGKAFAGKFPSATVVESSRSGVRNADEFRGGQLMLANAQTGRTVKLGDGYFYNLRLSPDGRFLAALMEGGAIQPEPDRPVEGWIVRRQLIVFELRAGRRKVIPCAACNVALGSLVWSADSSTLAFFASPTLDGSAVGQYFEYHADNQSLKPTFARDILLACDRLWPRPNRAVPLRKGLAVYARQSERAGARGQFSASTCDRGARYDWLLLTQSSQTNLSAQFRSVSGEPVGVSSDSLFVLADGNVWRLTPGRQPRNVTRAIDGALTAWDRGLEAATFSDEVRYTGNSPETRRLIVQTKRSIRSLDLDGGQTSQIEIPASGAQLASLSSSRRLAAFRGYAGNASGLILARRGETAQVVRPINSYLDDVEIGRGMQITYKYKGGDVSSCLLLPPGRARNARLPVIVDVYPNADYGDCAKWGSDIWTFDPYNRQLLATRGFAVLFPNTSRALTETVDGPTQDLPSAVLAAIDEAARRDVIDPQRLGLFGLSQGHQSVLQIVTNSHRFKAAVASHGISNFASEYGAMPLYSRLSQDAFSIGDAPRYESKQSDTWLGAPPWQDPMRYIRNSPLFFADKIDTPLLVMQSDFDAFPLDQSAEIFSALYRLRKEAVYVTYWGEGHGNLSPANIRDMWSRIFQWYDQHLNIAR